MLLGLALLSVVPAQAQESAPGTGYLVRSGDVLQVSVWKEPELTRELLVRPDGGFSFPLAGQVRAQGRVVEDIEREIKARIERYIPEPVVTVAVLKTQGNKVHVVGKVNRPGEYVMSSETDVMQALSMAGGTNSFAALNDIMILRRQPDGAQMAIPFRYGDVEDGENLEQNILLQSGDVVVVP
jgi:polysaccharide export outer membrane protein